VVQTNEELNIEGRERHRITSIVDMWILFRLILQRGDRILWLVELGYNKRTCTLSSEKRWGCCIALVFSS
jgi:hypothetical protein